MTLENVINVTINNDYIIINNRRDENIWCGIIKYIPTVLYHRTVQELFVKVVGESGYLVVRIE